MTPLPYKEPGDDELDSGEGRRAIAEFMEDEELRSLIRDSCMLSKGIKAESAEAEGLLPEEEVMSEDEDSDLQDSCMPQEVSDWHDRKMMFYKAFQNDDPVYSSQPTEPILYNFIKNIVTSAKMEKEAPVISYIYLKRLLEASRASLTAQTWRKAAFIATVLASKIWDDQSFENDSFAKAFS